MKQLGLLVLAFLGLPFIHHVHMHALVFRYIPTCHCLLVIPNPADAPRMKMPEFATPEDKEIFTTLYACYSGWTATYEHCAQKVLKNIASADIASIEAHWKMVEKLHRQTEKEVVNYCFWYKQDVPLPGCRGISWDMELRSAETPHNKFIQSEWHKHEMWRNHEIAFLKGINQTEKALFLYCAYNSAWRHDTSLSVTDDYLAHYTQENASLANECYHLAIDKPYHDLWPYLENRPEFKDEIAQMNAFSQKRDRYQRERYFDRQVECILFGDDAHQKCNTVQDPMYPPVDYGHGYGYYPEVVDYKGACKQEYNKRKKEIEDVWRTDRIAFHRIEYAFDMLYPSEC